MARYNNREISYEDATGELKDRFGLPGKANG